MTWWKTNEKKICAYVLDFIRAAQSYSNPQLFKTRESEYVDISGQKH